MEKLVFYMGQGHKIDDEIIMYELIWIICLCMCVKKMSVCATLSAVAVKQLEW